MPFVDSSIILCSGVGTFPCCFVDVLPEFSCFYGSHHSAITSCFQFPVTIGFKGVKKFIGYAYRIVAVLTTAILPLVARLVFEVVKTVISRYQRKSPTIEVRVTNRDGKSVDLHLNRKGSMSKDELIKIEESLEELEYHR